MSAAPGSMHFGRYRQRSSGGRSWRLIFHQQVAQAINAMGGFSLVLAGAKAFLEYGIELNLVADHNPDAHVGSSHANV